ncbi:MAG: hypothetical protein ACRD26_05755 [Vicinamibacterales bacterium]
MGVVGVEASTRPAAGGHRWRGAAYGVAIVLALGLGYFVVRIPVQLSDCLNNLIQVQEQTWAQAVTAGIGGGYMRPFLWAQIKAVYELANGHYTTVFRGVHLAQVLACAALAVGALRVRDASAALVVPFAVALLFGAHTFDGTIREAFPVNTFMTVVLACLAAVNLSLGSPSRWRDGAAVALFVAMLLTVESGVLVWVSLAACWAAGARGVSRRALVVTTACLAAYLLARFVLFDVGTPGLVERASGFGFETLEPRELTARFGDWPYAFYAYNVASQISTVLSSEPRTGVWVFVRSAMEDRVTLGQVISVLTTTVSTLLIAWFVADRARGWRRRDFDDADRVVITFLAVLVVNAVVSFPYTKDVIVSPAGAFHALAAAVALRHLIVSLGAAPAPRLAAGTVVVALLAAGAAVRLVGAGYTLRDASFVTRNDWTEVDAWAGRNDIDLTPPGRAALARRAPSPTFADPEWARYFY